jgi:hypothetical protein
MIKIKNDNSRSYILSNVDNTDKDEEIEYVNVSTLDKFVDENEIKKINYLKIDVEGYELNVLKGGINTLNKILPEIIQLELNPDCLKRNGIKEGEIRQFIEKNGYIYFSLDDKKNKLKYLSKDAILPFDLFLIHKNNVTSFANFIE